MITTELRIPEDKVQELLLPYLRGRLFHVTNLANSKLILADGQIRPNSDGSLKSAFGDYNSYFRNNGCVSLFDYRSVTEEQLQDSLWKCSPFMPANRPFCDWLVIFLLSRLPWTDLLPWHLCNEEKAWGEMVVPYVEAGHSGPLPVDLVDELLSIQIEPAKDLPPLAAALRQIDREKAICALIAQHPDGLTRKELLMAMDAHGDKAAEQSISNALAAMKKAGRLIQEGKTYKVQE